MGYYVRAFCRSNSIPGISALEASLKSQTPGIQFENVHSHGTAIWKEAELRYNPGRQPIVVELSVNDGPGSLAAEECDEFVDDLSAMEESSARDDVIEHLRNTRFVVCCQLLGDVDDEGLERNAEPLDYLVARHQGLVQADGEGFYRGADLIVQLQ